MGGYYGVLGPQDLELPKPCSHWDVIPPHCLREGRDTKTGKDRRNATLHMADIGLKLSKLHWVMENSFAMI